MTEALKPCPFCGRQPVYRRVKNVKTACYIACSRCDCSTRLEYAEKEDVTQILAEAWNERVGEEIIARRDFELAAIGITQNMREAAYKIWCGNQPAPADDKRMIDQMLQAAFGLVKNINVRNSHPKA